MVDFLHASHSFSRHRSRLVLPNDGLLGTVEIKLTRYQNVGSVLNTHWAFLVDANDRSVIYPSAYEIRARRRVWGMRDKTWGLRGMAPSCYQ